SNGVVDIYVNGSLEGTVTTPYPLDFGSGPVVIGGTASGIYDSNMKGEVDEVAIYNRALSAGEIAGIYAAGGAGKCTNAPATLRIGLYAQASTKYAGLTVGGWVGQPYGIQASTN